MKNVSLCVFDLDNTLFDWVAIWYAMFSAKLAEVVRISGLSAELLIPEFKAVHQYHGTTEYPFAIQELLSLQRLHPGGELRVTEFPRVGSVVRDLNVATGRFRHVCECRGESAGALFASTCTSWKGSGTMTLRTGHKIASRAGKDV